MTYPEWFKDELTKLYNDDPKTVRILSKDIQNKLGVSLKQQEIYDIIFDTPNIAPCGKQKKYKDFIRGYAFCEKKCKCSIEQSSRNARNTNIERYGFTSPMKSKSVQDKAKQTNLERYGVEYVAQNPEILQKVKQTNLERYGVEIFSKHSDFKNRRSKTIQERYGDVGLKHPAMAEKRQNTHMEKYGVYHSSQHADVKANTKKTNMDRYGVEHITQRNMSKDSLDILLNPEYLKSAYERKSIKEASFELGINPTTFHNYWHLHNLPPFEQSRSSYEVSVSNFFRDLDIRFEENNKTILNGKHIDFFLPDYKLGIEFNGIYWHSTAKLKDIYYHRKKYEGCRDAGIRLMMINQDEWDQRSSAVKSHIVNFLGKSERGFGARKLTIGQINKKEANSFYNNYHIQGSTGSIEYAIAAWHNDILVAVMAFNTQRKTKDIELIRYATNGKSYAGIFSKLLRYAFRENNYSQIISFADLRYSIGDVYLKNGFEFIKEIKPDYRYVYQGTTWHKSSFTKNNISRKFGIDIHDISEQGLMNSLGIPRIYDCGKLKFRYMG